MFQKSSMGFELMDLPASETFICAFESLYALGSLNNRGKLT